MRLMWLCLIAALAGAPLCAQDGNLLANPGFEDGEDGPLKWDLGMEGRGAGTATWVTDNPHSGEHCARTELSEAGDYWMARQRLEAGTAKPEHTYRLSGWYRGTNGCHPCVYFEAGDGAFLGAWETGMAPSEKWRPFSYVFRTRPGTERFQVQLRLQGEKGVCYWDDIRLEDADDLVKTGETLVAPLLALAEGKPDYLWALVSDGGSLDASFVGGPELELAYAAANTAGAQEPYEIRVERLDGDGHVIGASALDRPSGAELKAHAFGPAGKARTTRLRAASQDTGPGPILLVGIKLTPEVEASLVDLQASPLTRGDALALPWDARVLPASQERFEALHQANRHDVLRQALGGNAAGAARVCSAWLNNTDRQWLDWALSNGARREPQPIASGARNEFLSFQVLYAPPGNPKQVRARVGPLTSGRGTISASDCQTRLVEYVPMAGTWLPDPLMEDQPFDVSAHGPVVIWVTVHVPVDARPGLYRGVVSLRGDVGPATNREFSVRVWDFELPSETHLNTSFWISRAQLNRYYDIKGDIPMADYAPWVNLATSHRLSPIDFVEGPTVPMIKVFRDADGSLSYDFSHWDQYLDLLKAGGANTVHLGFTHWMANYFTGKQPEVTDRATGETVALECAFASKEHLDALAAYLKAADEHARSKGFTFTYIQPWDEPNGEGLERSYQILKGLKDRIPGIPRLMTAVGPDTHEGKMGEAVSLWCPLSPWLEGGSFDAMRDRGDIVWWYVCCAPRHPFANLFTDYKVAEMRALFWQTWQHRITGILYWSVNYWMGWGTPLPPPENRFPRGPWVSDTGLGDGYFMYPGPAQDRPLSSIRLETIRDGIEDYELLYLLDSLARRPGAGAEAVRRAQEVLKVRPAVSRNLREFDRDGSEMDAERDVIAGLVERLR